jgi:hypothetical protein
VLKILSDQITESTCPFSWTSPLNPRGEIQTYNIFIRFLNFSYFNPPSCKNDFLPEIEEIVMVDAGNEFTFKSAFPFASYLIQVRANNGEDSSLYSTPQTCETLPGLLIMKKE